MVLIRGRVKRTQKRGHQRGELPKRKVLPTPQGIATKKTRNDGGDRKGWGKGKKNNQRLSFSECGTHDSYMQTMHPSMPVRYMKRRRRREKWRGTTRRVLASTLHLKRAGIHWKSASIECSKNKAKGKGKKYARQGSALGPSNQKGSDHKKKNTKTKTTLLENNGKIHKGA